MDQSYEMNSLEKGRIGEQRVLELKRNDEENTDERARIQRNMVVNDQVIHKESNHDAKKMNDHENGAEMSSDETENLGMRKYVDIKSNETNGDDAIALEKRDQEELIEFQSNGIDKESFRFDEKIQKEENEEKNSICHEMHDDQSMFHEICKESELTEYEKESCSSDKSVVKTDYNTNHSDRITIKTFIEAISASADDDDLSKSDTLPASVNMKLKTNPATPTNGNQENQSFTPLQRTVNNCTPKFQRKQVSKTVDIPSSMDDVVNKVNETYKKSNYLNLSSKPAPSGYYDQIKDTKITTVKSLKTGFNFPKESNDLPSLQILKHGEPINKSLNDFRKGVVTNDNFVDEKIKFSSEVAKTEKDRDPVDPHSKNVSDDQILENDIKGIYDTIRYHNNNLTNETYSTPDETIVEKTNSEAIENAKSIIPPPNAFANKDDSKKEESVVSQKDKIDIIVNDWEVKKHETLVDTLNENDKYMEVMFDDFEAKQNKTINKILADFEANHDKTIDYDFESINDQTMDILLDDFEAQAVNDLHDNVMNTFTNPMAQVTYYSRARELNKYLATMLSTDSTDDLRNRVRDENEELRHVELRTLSGKNYDPTVAEFRESTFQQPANPWNFRDPACEINGDLSNLSSINHDNPRNFKDLKYKMVGDLRNLNSEDTDISADASTNEGKHLLSRLGTSRNSSRKYSEAPGDIRNVKKVCTDELEPFIDSELSSISDVTLSDSQATSLETCWRFVKPKHSDSTEVNLSDSSRNSGYDSSSEESDTRDESDASSLMETVAEAAPDEEAGNFLFRLNAEVDKFLCGGDRVTCGK